LKITTKPPIGGRAEHPQETTKTPHNRKGENTMTVRDYLNKHQNEASITFISLKAKKDDHSPFYHAEYRTTPISSAYDWAQNNKVCEKLVINADHPPIDVTGIWVSHYKAGRLLCAMITTEEELVRLYGEAQGRRMVEFYIEEVTTA
jgi:hypothetical protein